MKTVKALLVLEDGKVFEGFSFGAGGQRFGEVVFNTGMAGYQEILTDPSYKGQIVCMTYPLIGNYGVNQQDIESRKLFLEAFVVREASTVASNWRSEKGLSQYLKENNVIGIEGVDTRALTRHIRLHGAMKAVISTEEFDVKKLVKRAAESQGLVGRDLVKEVTFGKIQHLNKKGKYKVVVLDCGVKLNILRELVKRKCALTIVPAQTTAREILAFAPDGVLLSNGPGDPAAVTYVVETVKSLLGKVPVFGICLGHQMLGMALGYKTYKLKFGHHGVNHPVKDLNTGRIAITSQNHGFCVDIKEKNTNIEMTHVNLNDGTCEGIRHKKLDAFSVQFHPEAGPGPNDAKYLFDEFINMMKGNK